MDVSEKMRFLPTSLKEVRDLGWDSIDVILFSGDAYVDHPSFGCAVIGRVIESLGFRVAIVPQPNWRDDLRDFKKLGCPNLFFGISAGSMDSMVNHYTAAKRLRSDDAYTPDGRAGARPDMPTIVYSQILKKLYPDTPVLIGGIEASLRRVAHYDYWKDKICQSILIDSCADLLIYGMGEKPISEICRLLKQGVPFHSLTNIPQTVIKRRLDEKYATNEKWDVVQLNSYEQCIKDRRLHSKNFKIVEEASNTIKAPVLTQVSGEYVVVVNPPYPPLTTSELDAVYDLPFTRLPHPRYKGKEIPAYNMIRHSITMHRGCFGGCAFCTISAHQGKFISSRSEKSILQEAKKITEMPDFGGTITDLGGPSANMYGMQGRDMQLCMVCKRASCAFPAICNNLNTSHERLLNLYKSVSSVQGVKHCFVGSGVRYDLVLHDTGNKSINHINDLYLEALIKNHVSGRFKVAPEHFADSVLNIMRKPSFKLFEVLKRRFDEICQKNHIKRQLIPYFISSHPGCKLEDMAELAVATKELDFHLEQVQDFTPTPMTVATTIYCSGVHPYSGKKIETAKNEKDKLSQRMFFFWYKPEYKSSITSLLLKIGRKDLIDRLYRVKGQRH